MAIIDPRLQPLLAAMNEAGYDWLVSEVLDTLRQGRPRLATKGELESVRAKINEQDDTPEEITLDPDSSEPVVGDNQIDFVVDLVKGRFENVSAMINQSTKNLFLISMRSKLSAAEPKIAFQVDDEIRLIDPGTTAELLNNLNRLNESMDAWAASVRGTDGDAR